MVARRETVLLVLTMDSVEPVELMISRAVAVRAWRCVGVKDPAALAFAMTARAFRMAVAGDTAAIIAAINVSVEPDDTYVLTADA